MEPLILRDWLAIIAVLIAAGSFWFAFRRDRRDTKTTSNARPRVKVTVNKTYYGDGWRSVQLHVVPSDIQPNFPYQQWRILRARLVAPHSAALARAENDDYSTGVFFPEAPLREIQGRAQGRPQRFALEFFIRFQGDERGQQAKLKVTYGPADDGQPSTQTLTATVPLDASATAN